MLRNIYHKLKSVSEDSDDGTSEVSTKGSDYTYNMFMNQEIVHKRKRFFLKEVKPLTAILSTNMLGLELQIS